MRKISAQVDAFQRRIREQNEEARRRALARQEAQIAPLPADPMQCRWCPSRLKQIGDSKGTVLCPSGCGPDPILELECVLCHRMFRTGGTYFDTCYRCTAQEKRDGGSPLPRRDAWKARHRRIHGDEVK
jgi:hypothetical protein